jgi:hypothetical protein
MIARLPNAPTHWTTDSGAHRRPETTASIQHRWSKLQWISIDLGPTKQEKKKKQNITSCLFTLLVQAVGRLD